jgi:hypothetical protein
MSDHGDGERLLGLWDKYAPRYDRDMGFFERLQFGGGREWVCGQANGDVLEVAVGTGRNLAHYPDGVQLTGIDASPAMLEVARRRFPAWWWAHCPRTAAPAGLRPRPAGRGCEGPAASGMTSRPASSPAIASTP